jgi:hypothetical protein
MHPVEGGRGGPLFKLLFRDPLKCLKGGASYFLSRGGFFYTLKIIMYLYPFVSPALGRDFFYIGKVARESLRSRVAGHGFGDFLSDLHFTECSRITRRLEEEN